MILPNYPINKRFHNVSANQWAAWQQEAAVLDDLRNNKSGNEYLVAAKSFLEYRQQIPLHQWGDNDYPEYHLYVALSKRSQQIADRLDQLTDALRKHSLDASYTGDEIPLTVTIDPLNIPADYLNLPSRYTNQTITPAEIKDTINQLFEDAAINTQNQLQGLSENKILSNDKNVVTGGISKNSVFVLIGIIAIAAYFLFKPNKKK